MISVDTALSRIFDLVSPLQAEEIPLAKANGRVLAQDIKARRDQPPFASSAMDGYAVQADQVHPGATFTVVGEAAAGHRFGGSVSPGQAVRIFTGAPVPTGATRVIIQEDTIRDHDQITLNDNLDPKHYVRPAGGDFRVGSLLTSPRILAPADVALLAAMNTPTVSVARKPVVALIATGDELVMPGEAPNPDQIIASNAFGLAALVENAGAQARILPIARDNAASLRCAFDLAKGADIVVTIGGASVGDHDIVGDVAETIGMSQSFYKVAMRPGKPLMAGTLGDSVMLGLPGNPVSSMVCGTIFLLPAIRAMLGLGNRPAPRIAANLTKPLAKNGPREHYMRAHLQDGAIFAYEKQDSSLLTVLSGANALLVRPVADRERPAGSTVECIPL